MKRSSASGLKLVSSSQFEITLFQHSSLSSSSDLIMGEKNHHAFRNQQKAKKIKSFLFIISALFVIFFNFADFVFYFLELNS
jgi:hypothetical protein